MCARCFRDLEGSLCVNRDRDVHHLLWRHTVLSLQRQTLHCKCTVALKCWCRKDSPHLRACTTCSYQRVRLKGPVRPPNTAVSRFHSCLMQQETPASISLLNNTCMAACSVAAHAGVGHLLGRCCMPRGLMGQQAGPTTCYKKVYNTRRSTMACAPPTCLHSVCAAQL